MILGYLHLESDIEIFLCASNFGRISNNIARVLRIFCCETDIFASFNDCISLEGSVNWLFCVKLASGNVGLQVRHAQNLHLALMNSWTAVSKSPNLRSETLFCNVVVSLLIFHKILTLCILMHTQRIRLKKKKKTCARFEKAWFNSYIARCLREQRVFCFQRPWSDANLRQF